MKGGRPMWFNTRKQSHESSEQAECSIAAAQQAKGAIRGCMGMDGHAGMDGQPMLAIAPPASNTLAFDSSPRHWSLAEELPPTSPGLKQITSDDAIGRRLKSKFSHDGFGWVFSFLIPKPKFPSTHPTVVRRLLGYSAVCPVCEGLFPNPLGSSRRVDGV